MVLAIVRMEGLQQYVDKHGKHFTESLAYNVAGRHWSADKIIGALSSKVYYNVSGCTLGDIVYCVNRMNFSTKRDVQNFLLKDVLCNVDMSDRLFGEWVEGNEYFDLTPYL